MKVSNVNFIDNTLVNLPPNGLFSAQANYETQRGYPYGAYICAKPSSVANSLSSEIQNIEFDGIYMKNNTGVAFQAYSYKSTS